MQGSISFGGPPVITYGPQPVYYHPPPSRPLTTGESIIIGIVIVLFIIIFIWAAATGNIQHNQHSIQPRPRYYVETSHSQPMYKSKFTVPSELRDAYPFGDEYDPAIFSSGCCSF